MQQNGQDPKYKEINQSEHESLKESEIQKKPETEVPLKKGQRPRHYWQDWVRAIAVFQVSKSWEISVGGCPFCLVSLRIG